jgi:hypothetical protein
MSVIVTTRIDGLPEDTAGHAAEPALRAPNGKFLRLPVAQAPPEQRILAVEFRSPDGRYWNAIGGGATVAVALTYARESCPEDATWEPVSWNDLYGE